MQANLSVRGFPMRTTVSAALARPAREQIDVRLLDVENEVRAIYVSASDRVLPVLAKLGLRWQWVRRRRADQAYRAVADAAADLVTLWNAGATEAELRQLASYLNGLLDRLSTGCAQRPLSTLDQEETVAEGAENSLQTERLILEGQRCHVPAELLVREADATEYEAHIGIEKARVLRRRARGAAVLSCVALPMTLVDSTGAVVHPDLTAQIALLVLVGGVVLFGIAATAAALFGRHRRL